MTAGNSPPMEVDVEPSETLRPRPYQDQILDVCLEKNTIIYLPTGAGKTFIAMLAMKQLAKNSDKYGHCTIQPKKKILGNGNAQFSFSFLRPLSEGGQRAIFVVNTVALANQQKLCVEKHTPFRAAVYTGDLNVDDWTDDQWSDEFEKYQVSANGVSVTFHQLKSNFSFRFSLPHAKSFWTSFAEAA